MAVNYPRTSVNRQRAEAVHKSTTPQTKPHQRVQPTNVEQLSPVEKQHQSTEPVSGSSKISVTPSAGANSSGGVPAAEASSKPVVIQEHAGSRRPDYDSDIEAESAYQKAMWEKIQRSQHEIQQMRTPILNVLVPVSGSQEPNQWLNSGNGSINGSQKSGMTASQTSHNASHHRVPVPPNYVDLNRRQVHQRSGGLSVGRQVALYPPKTYLEMFAKKKENETSYTSVGTKNGKTLSHIILH